MLAGLNDNPEQAHELGRLLGPRSQQYLVNLIPWNPVFSPGIDFKAPGPDRLAAFHDIVRAHDLQCTVRREMGQEIAGRLLAPVFLVDIRLELMMWTSGSARSEGLGQAWLEEPLSDVSSDHCDFRSSLSSLSVSPRHLAETKLHALDAHSVPILVGSEVPRLEYQDPEFGKDRLDHMCCPGLFNLG